MGICFWVLWILCAIAFFTGYAVGGIHMSAVITLVLFMLVGWKCFGAPLQ